MLWLGHAKLKSKDPGERREAVEKLGMPGNSKAVEPLIQALEDEDRTVREAAAISLGKIGDFRATGALVEALKRTDYVMVQARVAISLGKAGDAGGLTALMAALNRQIEQLPVQAGSHEDKILTGLLQIPELGIKEQEAQAVFLQIAAIIALVQTQNSKAARMLAEILTKEESNLMTFQIATALKKYGMPVELRKLESDMGIKLDDVISKAESHLGDVGAYAARAIETLLCD